MTADADRPSAGNVALVRKYLEKHGVTSTEDGRIVIATLLEKVSKKHDDFCNEMAERIEAATASQRKRIDALTAREAALLARAESAERERDDWKEARQAVEDGAVAYKRDRDALAAQVGVLRELLQTAHTHYGVHNPDPHPTCRWCIGIAATAEAAARRDEALIKADRAEHWPKIQAQERERCAKVADERANSLHTGDGINPATPRQHWRRHEAQRIAAAIRALSPGTADAGEGA